MKYSISIVKIPEVMELGKTYSASVRVIAQATSFWEKVRPYPSIYYVRISFNGVNLQKGYIAQGSHDKTITFYKITPTQSGTFKVFVALYDRKGNLLAGHTYHKAIVVTAPKKKVEKLLPKPAKVTYTMTIKAPSEVNEGTKFTAKLIITPSIKSIFPTATPILTFAGVRYRWTSYNHYSDHSEFTYTLTAPKVTSTTSYYIKADLLYADVSLAKAQKVVTIKNVPTYKKEPSGELSVSPSTFITALPNQSVPVTIRVKNTSDWTFTYKLYIGDKLYLNRTLHPNETYPVSVKFKAPSSYGTKASYTVKLFADSKLLDQKTIRIEVPPKKFAKETRMIPSVVWEVKPSTIDYKATKYLRFSYIIYNNTPSTLKVKVSYITPVTTVATRTYSIPPYKGLRVNESLKIDPDDWGSIKWNAVGEVSTWLKISCTANSLKFETEPAYFKITDIPKGLGEKIKEAVKSPFEKFEEFFAKAKKYLVYGFIGLIIILILLALIRRR